MPLIAGFNLYNNSIIVPVDVCYGDVKTGILA